MVVIEFGTGAIGNKHMTLILFTHITATIKKEMSSTPLPVTHRVYFKVCTVRDWYKIIREAHALYGTNWQGQRHVKRKLERPLTGPLKVWFDVPDEKFATWISVKHSISAAVLSNK